MDNEYLRHLDGSVYIDEGLGDRLKSWGSALSKKFGNTPAATPAVPTAPDNSKTAYARIIERTLETIIDAVKSDVAHVPDWVDNPSKVSTRWGQVKEDDNEDDFDDEDDVGDKETPRKSKITRLKKLTEFEGEFLYNFWGKYKKFRTFAIIVKPITVSKTIVLTDLGYPNNKDLTVYWQNERHFNIINVVITTSKSPTGEDRSETRLLAFWDHLINPKHPASANLSLKSLMDTANPPAYGKDTNPLGGADPTLVAKITAMCNGPLSPVGLVLNAVVARKSMEFKVKKKEDLSLRLIDNGSGDVWMYDKNRKPTILKKNDIVKRLAQGNMESEILRRSLNHIDYFMKNPDVIEPPPFTTAAPTVSQPLDPKVLRKTYHEFDDAVLAVIELSKGKGRRLSQTNAEKLILNAWETLIAAGNTPDNIKGTMLMQTILSKVKKPKTTTEELINPFQSTNFLQY